MRDCRSLVEEGKGLHGGEEGRRISRPFWAFRRSLESIFHGNLRHGGEV